MDLDPYPVSDLEVLQTWRKREDEWATTYRLGASGRSRTCFLPSMLYVKIGPAVTLTPDEIRYVHSAFV